MILIGNKLYTTTCYDASCFLMLLLLFNVNCNVLEFPVKSIPMETYMQQLKKIIKFLKKPNLHAVKIRDLTNVVYKRFDKC